MELREFLFGEEVNESGHLGRRKLALYKNWLQHPFVVGIAQGKDLVDEHKGFIDQHLDIILFGPLPQKGPGSFPRQTVYVFGLVFELVIQNIALKLLVDVVVILLGSKKDS